MKQHMRHSGLSVLGEIPWGSHLCHLYGSASEITEIMLPYFSAGLSHNEKCIWVCSEPLEVREAERALAESVPNLFDYIASGQMQIVSYRDWYLNSEGRFLADDILERWRVTLDSAMAGGFDGLRVAGNTSWIDEKTWESFEDYEDRIYGSLAHEPMLTVCTYPRHGAWVPDVVDIIRCHQRALVRREQGWELIDCGRRREIEWEGLFDEIAEGVLITDESGNILMANDTFTRYFGVRSLGELGTNLRDLSRRFSFRTPAGDTELGIDPLIEEGAKEAQFWTALPEGTDCTIDLLVHAREIRPSSMASKRFLVLFQNVTELTSFESVRDRALRMMTHELRNPLQVMKAVIPLLASVRDDGLADVKRYAKTLSTQVNHLSSLVEALLTAGRIDSDRLEVSMRLANLTDIVDDCVGSIGTAGTHEIVSLHASGLEVPVWVDSVRVRQILVNLLANAVKYTPPTKRIWVDVCIENRYALARVADEGIGIPKGEVDLAFQAFYRATNSALVSREGIGLGLFISRQLARRHGGDLWAEQRQGGGTIMNLSLPVCENGAFSDMVAGGNTR